MELTANAMWPSWEIFDEMEALVSGRKSPVRYASDSGFGQVRVTDSRSALPEEDHSIQFALPDLSPGVRWHYQIEFREDETAVVKASDVFSFKTAREPDQRAPITFHLTTCQNLHGESTYLPMAAQQPDFCMLAGDTVYHDGQGDARTVPQAWQAYQKLDEAWLTHEEGIRVFRQVFPAGEKPYRTFRWGERSADLAARESRLTGITAEAKSK